MTMADQATGQIVPLNPLTLSSGVERMFPTLTPAQIERVAERGRRRSISSGEVLVEAGAQIVPFFVITRGRVEVVRPSSGADVLVALHGPGQFTGEVNMLSGRPALLRSRVVQAGEAIELSREQLLALVQTDSEASELIMRAFILRRVELIARGLGDVVLLGSSFCSETLRVKEFLTRNGHPYSYIDLDRDSAVQEFLDRFHVMPGDVPVVICRGELVLRNPDNRKIAECLGFNTVLDGSQTRDVVIVGAGPAGLAAAVYAASEGLDTLVLETNSPGGQAGSSSKIENYLGFPTGISGQALAGRAYTQARKFGAQMIVAGSAQRLVCDNKPYAIEMDDGTRVLARAIIIATGAEYRVPKIERLAEFKGVGVYYGATFMEAQLCRDEEVVVVGGGNSAGQAAVFLAQTAKRVHMLVRGKLADSMSRYLIRRIEQNSAISLRTNTEIVGCEGDNHLERLRWRDDNTGQIESRDIRHVFVMTGAVPTTQWLQNCLALDDKGFIKTGPDLSQEDLTLARWRLARHPHLLETSLAGVFAVGDVRSGNVKRVASAVGEGSIAISFVHKVLTE
jgi:thioredoxin reductase (NADPH)